MRMLMLVPMPITMAMHINWSSKGHQPILAREPSSLTISLVSRNEQSLGGDEQPMRRDAQSMDRHEQPMSRSGKSERHTKLLMAASLLGHVELFSEQRQLVQEHENT